MLEKKEGGTACPSTAGPSHPLDPLEEPSTDPTFLTSTERSSPSSNRSSTSSSNSNRSSKYPSNKSLNLGEAHPVPYSATDIYKGEIEAESGGSGESVISSSGKRSKSKGSSNRSNSEEIIAQDDEPSARDMDPEKSTIPRLLISGRGNGSSDVDSAFEDSPYSGSSDDKSRTPAIPKVKSKRRCSEGSSSFTGFTNPRLRNHSSSSRRHENIDEMPQEEPSFLDRETQGQHYPGRKGVGEKDYVRERRTLEGIPRISFDYYEEEGGRLKEDCSKMDNMNLPEPALFEMELSPANYTQQIMTINTSMDEVEDPYAVMDYLQKYKNPEEHSSSSDFGTEEPPPAPPLHTKKDGIEASERYSSIEDLDAHGHPTTILLPPLEIPRFDLQLQQESSTFSQCADPLGPLDLGHQDDSATVSANMKGITVEGGSANGSPERLGSGDGKGRRSIGGGADSNADPVQELNRKVEEGEDEDFEVVYVVPDGGWGWMVLFGSILVNILIPGMVKSFGVLFVEFLEVFNASPVAAAWIPALSYCLYSSMGPFASALAIKFSHRSVTIVGGLLASLGLMLSYFATSISYLYVSYGLIGGLGAGLAYPIGVFMVGQYFEKRRGLANGLCTSGSALGSVLIPPLLRVLLVEYGYRGAILIMGGILLNVCVGAMFYDPVSKHMKRTLVPREKVALEDANSPKVEEKTLKSEADVIRTPPPIRRITSPIPRVRPGPTREIAASMPIAIPLPSQNGADFRDQKDRRGSGGARKATFQIGHETPQGESWSFKSNELGSPLAARLGKEEIGSIGSPKWGMNTPVGIRIRGHLPNYSNHDSNPELESLIHSSSTGAIGNPCISTPNPATLSVSAMGNSRGQSRLNLTAIPEDDDTSSLADGESPSRQADWTYYSALPAAKQRLLRLSMGSGTQLVTTGSQGPSHPPFSSQGKEPGLSRTMSVASNVSSSSFHYVSTIHHGSLLTAMQMDKHLPEFASTLTLKSVRASCCPRLSTLKELGQKASCGLWRPKKPDDEPDQSSVVVNPTTQASQRQEPKKRSEGLKKFIDLSLLKDGIYIIMLLSISTTAVGYTNFIVLLPSYALSMGFDKSEAANLLSVVAALDFVGRIGGAALSDLQLISRKWFYIVGHLGSGIALALLPIARTYTGLVLFCSAFGLASGTYIGVIAVILADQLGAEKLGSSYGISLFLSGLLQLAGPPICGLVFQEIGRLEPILTGLGIILIFGAALWIFTPFIERRRNRLVEEKGETLGPNAYEQSRKDARKNGAETSLV